MMNIIRKLNAWINNTMTMSADEMLFVEFSKLN